MVAQGRVDWQLREELAYGVCHIADHIYHSISGQLIFWNMWRAVTTEKSIDLAHLAMDSG